MFQYNRFWHFLYTLDNRHYLRALVLSFLALTICAYFLPELLAYPLISLAVPVLFVAGAITTLTRISDSFYNQQNLRLSKLHETTNDELLKNTIELYLNRRVVTPQELLKGLPLIIPQAHTKQSAHTSAMPPLILDENTVLQIKAVSQGNRNTAFIADTSTDKFYIKQTAAADTLSEIAARELAEIIGFKDLIPSNTLSKTDVIQDQDGQIHTQLPSDRLILSRLQISDFIDKENQGRAKEQQINNSVTLQDTLAKAVLNFKSKTFSAQARKNNLTQLMHIQKITPNAINGSQWLYHLMDVTTSTSAHAVRLATQKQLERIDINSFQENFLLQLLLGTQDCHSGNTLLIDVPDESIKMQSIDHERIMPEDNYNITKFIPLCNGDKPPEEKAIKNVFPIRLWLAGLPQAEAPFSKAFIKRVLNSLNPQRLLAYHKQKNLFSQAAVGAQLDRVLLVKQLFTAEHKKEVITLTPKELFLKCVANHPSYGFLKDTLGLHNIFVFSLLGFIPTDADYSLLRHPLQWLPITKAGMEVSMNQAQEKTQLFSTQGFADPSAYKCQFFSNAKNLQQKQAATKQYLEIIDEVANHLRN